MLASGLPIKNAERSDPRLPSVAVATFYSNAYNKVSSMNDGGGDGHGNGEGNTPMVGDSNDNDDHDTRTSNTIYEGGERITMVATCCPPPSYENDESDSAGGRISLATIVDYSPHRSRKGDTQKYQPNCGRAVGVQYLSNVSPGLDEKYLNGNAYFSVVCLTTTVGGNSSGRVHAVLLAIDSLGRLFACSINNICTKLTMEKDGTNRLDMTECKFDHESDEKAKMTSKSNKKAKTEKKTSINKTPEMPPLNLMNTLTTRMEASLVGIVATAASDEGDTTCMTSLNNTQDSSTQNSTPNRKGRKRKLSPSNRRSKYDKSNEESKHGDANVKKSTPKTGGVYVVASNLNESMPPSVSPPIVMYITPSSSASKSITDSSKSSSDLQNSYHGKKTHKSADTTQAMQWEGLAWSKIPGLENVETPMTSILFASESMCGQAVWSGIVSAIGKSKYPAKVDGTSVVDSIDPNGGTNKKERDQGVILMGFQDGSLRVSFVTKMIAPMVDSISGHDELNNILDITPATTLLQLVCNEPIISIQLLCPSYHEKMAEGGLSSTASILMCVGALGTIVTLKSFAKQKDNQCSGAIIPSKFDVVNHYIPCNGCLVLIKHIGCQILKGAPGQDDDRKDVSSLSLDIHLIATNDSGRTFLHSIMLPFCGGSGLELCNSKTNDMCVRSVDGWRLSSFRLPVPGGMPLSIASSSPFSSKFDFGSLNCSIFAVSTNSKVVVLIIPRLLEDSFYGDGPQCSLVDRELDSPRPKCGGGLIQHAILRKLKRKGSIALVGDEVNTARKAQKLMSLKSKTTQLHDLVKKLQSTNTTIDRNEASAPVATTCQPSLAMKEIREAARISSILLEPSTAGVPIEVKIRASDPLKCGHLKYDFTFGKLPSTKESTALWSPSVHILQSLPSSLSSLLRPESIKGMPPICYRLLSRERGRPIKVVYGGMAISNTGNGEILSCNVPVYDVLPVAIFASFHMVYGHVNAINDQSGIADWCLSVRLCDKLRQYKRKGSPKNDAFGGALLCPSGAAKRMCAGNGNGSICEQILGVAIPFDFGTKTNPSCTLVNDILTNTLETIDCNRMQSGDNLTARNLAEKTVYQAISSKESLLPFIKEEHLIRRHSRAIIEDMDVVNDNAYCSSGSMRLLNATFANRLFFTGAKAPSQYYECCSNSGIGPLALCHLPKQIKGAVNSQDQVEEYGFAIGSSPSTPNESLSLLPLVRQSLIRRIFELQCNSQTPRGGKDEMKLLLLYHMLLSEKQTMKAAKHVARSSEELLTNSDISMNDPYIGICHDSLLAKSTSLYEILRTIQATLY